MRNVSRAFLLIGGIVAIIAIFSFIGSASLFFATAGLNDDSIHTIISPCYSYVPGDSLVEKAEFVRAFCKAFAVICIFLSLFSIPTAIISFSSRAKQSQGLLITALVFGILMGSTFMILGAIFGLVANSKERNQRVINAQ